MLELGVSVEDAGSSTVVVRVEGELDVVTRAQLVDAATEALGNRPRLLILDLERLGFCDAAGVHALASIRQLAEWHDADVVVRGASRLVRLIADTLGVELRFHDELAHPLGLAASR